MPVIVEDGSIVSNSNSYVSEATFEAFATARGITLTGDSEELLIKSMDYLETLQYKGVKRTKEQSLQWPRTGVWVDSYWIDSDEIPTELKNGQMQCAIAIDQGNDPLQDLTKNTIREKVGDLEVEYSSSSVTSTKNMKISSSLKKLLASGSGVLNVTKG